MVKTTRERWCESEVDRVAGEILLRSPQPDLAKAEGYLDRALTVARTQQARSLELRAAMSMARYWRDRASRSGQGNCSLRPTTGSPKASRRLT
jgi:predicted ATPase